MKKGFAFSFDAFMAFIISMLALYSMVYFSSISTTYYKALLQAHYLAKDFLYTLSTTDASVFFEGERGTLLEFLMKNADPESQTSGYYFRSLGDLFIPYQYGFEFYTSDDGEKWSLAYSTKNDDLSNHRRVETRVKATATTVLYFFSSFERKDNPYSYYGDGRAECWQEGKYGVPCLPPEEIVNPPEPDVRFVRVAVFS